MATHSSILAWRIPWTEEPGGLQSTESQRVGHDWATSLSLSLEIEVKMLIPDYSHLKPWKELSGGWTSKAAHLHAWQVSTGSVKRLIYWAAWVSSWHDSWLLHKEWCERTSREEATVPFIDIVYTFCCHILFLGSQSLNTACTLERGGS